MAGVGGRATGVELAAWWQDLTQPAWTRISGGCHPNRDTETMVDGCASRVIDLGVGARVDSADHHDDRRAARS